MATRGFYNDIIDSFTADLQHAITDELETILEHRQIIDLAKGMLMAVYRIDADAAFGVLRWRCQELNVRLLTIAERLVAEPPDVVSTSLQATSPVDYYLMSLSLQGAP